MTIIMALAAISSADPEMTSLDTMPATRMATKRAWRAGWARNVTEVCGPVLGGLKPALSGCRHWGQVLSPPSQVAVSGWGGVWAVF